MTVIRVIIGTNFGNVIILGKGVFMKKSIIVIIILIILGAGIGLCIKSNKIIDEVPNYKPNSDYDAVISHSESQGIDAGVTYIYYLYHIKDHTYIYIKLQSNITIAGAGERIRVGSGKIRKKSDLRKIKRDIKQDTEKGAYQDISYQYINNGNLEECSSITELANKLF